MKYNCTRIIIIRVDVNLKAIFFPIQAILLLRVEDAIVAKVMINLNGYLRVSSVYLAFFGWLWGGRLSCQS